MNRTLALLATTALAASGTLAACSSGDATDASASDSGSGTSATGTASSTSPATTPPTTSTSPGRPTTTTTRPTTTAAPRSTALPKTFTDVKKTVKDSDLGQSVTVNKIARNLPWPKGYNASADAYELVALEMTWTPSKDYTIPIRAQDFVVTSGATKNKRETLLDSTLKTARWTLLPSEVSTGNPVTGWMVFRVDPRGAKTLGLDYTRPPAEVTGSDTTFPTKTVSIPLVG